MRPYQQVHDENAVLRVKERDAISRGQVSNQRIHANTREGAVGNSIDTQTKKLEMRGKKEGEGTEEKGLVQNWRIRHGALHGNDTQRETEEDVRKRDTQEWITNQGGGT